jgi:hypothetical protein
MALGSVPNVYGWRIRADGSCRHVCGVWGRRSMHAMICIPWAFIVALWHVEDPTMGAYIATTRVATYAPAVCQPLANQARKKTDEQNGTGTTFPTYALSLRQPAVCATRGVCVKTLQCCHSERSEESRSEYFPRRARFLVACGFSD